MPTHPPVIRKKYIACRGWKHWCKRTPSSGRLVRPAKLPGRPACCRHRLRRHARPTHRRSRRRQERGEDGRTGGDGRKRLYPVKMSLLSCFRRVSHKLSLVFTLSPLPPHSLSISFYLRLPCVAVWSGCQRRRRRRRRWVERTAAGSGRYDPSSGRWSRCVGGGGSSRGQRQRRERTRPERHRQSRQLLGGHRLQGVWSF